MAKKEDKSLMAKKTLSGREGVTVMTKAASEVGDDFNKTRETKRRQDHIFIIHKDEDNAEKDSKKPAAKKDGKGK